MTSENWDSAPHADHPSGVHGRLEVPTHPERPVHDLYFNPQHEEFQPRTLWSLSDAFTSAFKELEPIPQFHATAKLAGFLKAAPREPLII